MIPERSGGQIKPQQRLRHQLDVEVCWDLVEVLCLLQPQQPVKRDQTVPDVTAPYQLLHPYPWKGLFCNPKQQEQPQGN